MFNLLVVVNMVVNSTLRALGVRSVEEDAMQLGRSPVSLADLLSAGLLRPGQSLWFRKGDSRAELGAHGTIHLDGKEYSSPSSAAKAAANGTSTNGWRAWYVKEGGGWTHLADLRSRVAHS